MESIVKELAKMGALSRGDVHSTVDQSRQLRHVQSLRHRAHATAMQPKWATTRALQTAEPAVTRKSLYSLSLR